MIFCMQKVSLPASSNDAASDSDTKSQKYIGIGKWYCWEGYCVYQKSITASIIQWCYQREWYKILLSHRNWYVILFGRRFWVSKKYCCQHHPMMLLAIVIQNLQTTQELVYDTVGRNNVCIKKVLPLASSEDAASNSDTNYIYYIGIDTWYFSYGDFGYQKSITASIIWWCR